MQILGQYLLRGYWQGVWVSSVFAFLSLFFPPLAYVLCGTPIVLVTLHYGALFSFQVICGAFLLLIISFFLISINPIFAVLTFATIWIPLWLLSLSLRYFRSQGVTLAIAGLFSLVLIIGLNLGIEDLSMWWQESLFNRIEAVLPTQAQDKYKALLLPIIPYISGLLGISLTMCLILPILVGRWWQGRLFNPVGFSKEFQSLKLPSFLLYLFAATYVILLLSHDSGRIISINILLLLVYLYFFQGLAILHWWFRKKPQGRWYLIGAYILLFVFPWMVVPLAIIGLLDAVVRIRERFSID